MKKRSFAFAIIILGCVFYLLVGSKRLYEYYSWAEKRTTTHTPNSILSDDTLRVIMIGDSWAAYHHDNDTILASLLQEDLHRPVRVVSSGMVGAKTKAIYELMFDSISPLGIQNLINKKPEYCIISAGINDAVAKMGTNNYCYHYCLIIHHLLSSCIKPVVLDMPDVDYKSVYKRESIIANARHRISSWCTKVPMWSFEDYRKELDIEISLKGLRNRIIYIPSTEWNPKGFEDPRNLYLEDHIHLNKKGYSLLDACIASYISQDYKSTKR